MFKKLLILALAVAAVLVGGNILAGGIYMNSLLESCGYQGWKTAANTDTIKVTIPPYSGARPVILGGTILASATAHKSYFMYPVSQTTLAEAMTITAVACTTTDSTPDAGGNAPAAGDIFVIEKNNGSYQTVTCSVYATGKSIQFKQGELVALASSAGKKVFVMGAPGDANAYIFQLAASGINTYPSEVIVGRHSWPMVFRSSCVTAVDTLGYLSWGYSQK